LERGDAEVGRGLLVGLSGDEGGFDVVDDGHDVVGLLLIEAVRFVKPTGGGELYETDQRGG
jgi:hypothetical protein